MTRPEPAANVCPQAMSWLAAATPVPEFSIPDTLEQWIEQRSSVRATLWKLLGDLPARPAPPAVLTSWQEDRGDYRIERFEFNNGAGSVVPGYLILPADISGKVPGVLYCHWHGGQYDLGKEELFGSDHTPEPPALALAKRGFAVLAIDAFGFGERNGQGPGGITERGPSGEMAASKFNLWLGRTLWGMMLRDDLMALDYLASRLEIDPTRIAVTGISMGATRSWWLMALDERIRTGVAVACLTRYQNLILSGGVNSHGIYYFVPGLLKHFDTEAIVALIAPRPVLLMNGDRDPGSPAGGIREIETKVRSIYRLYGVEPQFANVVYPQTGHEYLPAMWQKMLAWLERHLGGPD